MKEDTLKYLIILFITFLTIFSQAKEVIIEVPDDVVAYDLLSKNFDGSFSIKNPRVLASGRFLPIADSVYGYHSSTVYTCMLFGFSSKGSSSVVGPTDNTVLTASLGYTSDKGVFLHDIWSTADVEKLKDLRMVNCNSK